MTPNATRARRHYYKHRTSNLPKHLFHFAKKRAKTLGIPFEITEEDIQVPEKCPLTGLLLERGEGRIIPQSPTLDRVDNSLGYVPGNVRVISNKANRQKGNLTRDEVLKLLDYMDNKI